MINKFNLLIFSIAGCLVLSGCSDQRMNDLTSYVASEKEKKAGRIRPVPEFKAYDSYIYAVGKDSRSPFEPTQHEELITNTVEPGDGLSPDINRHKESLESFPLDTLRYVGSLEQKGKIWAIIISPDSLIHKIKVGNYMGQNYGKIMAITDTGIEISELVTNGMGGWIERLAGLSLIE
ncbi:MAG: pilus assembly protein PilP [Chromatiales bacterium]|nr:pilus assembly protein PilP [Chromatiales bacterium]